MRKKWLRELDFSPFWEDDIPLGDKGILINKEMDKIKKFYERDDDFLEVADAFLYITGDREPAETSKFTIIDDFNERMDELYDWADYNKIWVKT